jgi:pyrroline-5-carboxylate reductase
LQSLNGQSPGETALIVAVLGAGKIGESVARAMAKSARVSQVLVTKRNVSTLGRQLPRKILASTDNAAAAGKADVVILAVKAADAKHILDEISGQTHGKVVISFMAAISLSKLERHLPGAKVVRAMTNLAAVVGEAATAYSVGSNVTTEDLNVARFVMGRLGEYVELP